MASQPPQQQQQPARFVLSRAGPADAGAIAAADYQCFDEYVREVFMGVKCEADVPLLADWYARMMRDDPHDVWIKVVDAQSGRLAAASNWKVYPSRMPDDAGDKTPDHLVDEVARARSKLAVDGVNRARRKAMGDVGGFIHLHICFTVPDYRRQGAAGLMMRWGCGLADQLSVPAYVEASPDGTALYKAFGFYEIDRADAGELDAINMRRDVAPHDGEKR